MSERLSLSENYADKEWTTRQKNVETRFQNITLEKK